MSTTIRTMTAREFEIFYTWSAESQAKDLMAEQQISWEAAIREAQAELAQMLPLGIHTQDNFLMTIVDEGGESAGFLWMLHEEFQGKKQCFLCDFAIWEPKRRQGFGSAALALAEKHAMNAGCVEIVLFVRDDNEAALGLYRKCGYTVLRQRDSGAYMVKPLTK